METYVQLLESSETDHRCLIDALSFLRVVFFFELSFPFSLHKSTYEIPQETGEDKSGTKGGSAFASTKSAMIRTYKIGMNRSVSVKLPKLPAKKVQASH